MSARDIEREVSPKVFVNLLRRLADSIEAGQPFRVQVGGHRFRIPAGASLALEHETEGRRAEFDLQLSWTATRQHDEANEVE